MAKKVCLLKEVENLEGAISTITELLNGVDLFTDGQDRQLVEQQYKAMQEYARVLRLRIVKHYSIGNEA